MVGNVDLDLLEKTYQNAAIGITAIEAVINKVSSKEMHQQLHRQLQNYQELADKSKQQLLQNGAKVKDNSYFEKAMMKGNVKMNTMINCSDSHIAQMVIQGSTMGVTQMTRLLHENAKADGASVRIAKDFVQREEKNIEVMKNYL